MSMLKVVTINLNGNAYQVDENAFEALRGYLDDARQKLSQNPDRAEILTDLEQAIADKCDTFLGAHKNVVDASEMGQILKEMGPVEGAAEQPRGNTAHEDGQSTSTGEASSSATPTRRLFRLPEQGMLGGVCAGLAAYFNVDVVWVRLLFVILTFVTGIWIVAWLVMLFVMPRAQTPEDVALAHGEPFNAQDVINRVKKKYDEYSGVAADLGRRQWQQHESTVKSAAADVKQGVTNLADKLRSKRSDMHRAAHRRHASVYRQPQPSVGYGAQVLAGLTLPVLSILSAALFVVFVAGLLLLLGNSAWFAWWPLPNVPTWALIAVLVLAYLIVAAPVGVARRASRRYANGGRNYGWASSLDALLWLVLVAAFGWVLLETVPGLGETITHLFGMSPHHMWVMI
ncbi:MAG: PspC domain-containing protein [Steroidobacteraceae bacterium]